jgi:hypothetical protein
MLGAALRRLVLVVIGALVGTAVVSLLIGLAVGSTVDRSLTLGFYLAGCLLLLGGFFLGNRGPARVRSEEATGFLFGMFGGGRRLRWATLREQDESINSSALCVALGVVLVFAGFLVDGRHSLF